MCQLPHRSQYNFWICLHCEHIIIWIAGRSTVQSLVNDFIWDNIVLLALQMLTAFCSVKSGSLRSLLRVLSQHMPHAIQSLIKPSLSSLNSHIWALVFRPVTYWSIVLLSCWLQVLNTCLSHVMYCRGTQYALNFSRIFVTLVLSPSSSHVNVL